MKPQLEWTTSLRSGAAGVKVSSPDIYRGTAAARRLLFIASFPLPFPNPSFLHLLISEVFMEKKVMELGENKEEGLFIHGFADFLTSCICIYADLTLSY